MSEGVYIDLARVEAVALDPNASAVDGRPKVSITLQNSVVIVPLGKATIEQVVNRINDACMVLRL